MGPIANAIKPFFNVIVTIGVISVEIIGKYANTPLLAQIMPKKFYDIGHGKDKWSLQSHNLMNLLSTKFLQQKMDEIEIRDKVLVSTKPFENFGQTLEKSFVEIILGSVR